MGLSSCLKGVAPPHAYAGILLLVALALVYLETRYISIVEFRLRIEDDAGRLGFWRPQTGQAVDGEMLSHHWLSNLPSRKFHSATLEAQYHEACGDAPSCLSIHVFANQRLNSTQGLLEQLRASNYSSYRDPIPLIIHLDRPNGNDETEQWAAFSAIQKLTAEFQWSHGPKIVNIHRDHAGLRKSWLTAWTNPRPDDIMIAFEDDVVPSLSYFQWLLQVLDRYDLWRAASRDPLLLGISLSPIRLDEINHPFRPWMAHEVFNQSTYPVYLHALPSSWGVLFFGDQWANFLNFVDLRASQPFYWESEDVRVTTPDYAWGTRQGDPNLWLPHSMTNSWVHSWKRFLVDFSNARGAYTIYPNIASSAGLATSRFFQGEHYRKDQSLRNPREAPLATAREIWRSAASLPPYDALPLVDIHCNVVGRLQHAQRGDWFLRRIASLGPHYLQLVRAWKRPCALEDKSVGRWKETNPSLITSRQLIVSPPPGADLYTQLLAVLWSSLWAHELDRTLLLPPLSLSASLPSAEASLIPYSAVFDPDGVSKVLPGLSYAHAETHNLRSQIPSRVGVFVASTWQREGAGRGFSQAVVGPYFTHLGWDRVPRTAINASALSGDPGDSRFYVSFGSCLGTVLPIALADEQLLSLDRMVSMAGFSQIQGMWSALFKPSRIVEHYVNKIKAQMEYRYACLQVNARDLSERALGRFEAYHAKASSIDSPHLFIVSQRGHRVVTTVLGIDAKHVVHDASAMVATYVEVAMPATYPDASLEFKEAVTSLVVQKVCAEADVVILERNLDTVTRAVELYRKGKPPIQYWT